MAYKALTEENVRDFKNFKYKEFACKCDGKYCDGFPVSFSYELAKNLQKVRDHFGKPLIITSAVRCEKHNANVGGVRGSKHKKGCAVDFYINGVSYYDLDMYVRQLPYYNYSYRVIKNQNVIHYDIIPPSIKKPYEKELPTLPSRGYFKKGDRGNEVKKLQALLNWLNGSKLVVDGILGNYTINEIKTFQKANKLVVDGLFGKKCLAKAKQIIKQ